VAGYVDGSGADEIAADLNYLGLWLKTETVWSQLR
jgi:hypothetical protein